MSDPTPAIADDAAPSGASRGTSRGTSRNPFLTRFAGSAAALILRLIGITLRVTVSIEEGGPPSFYVPAAVYSFWHRCILPATWQYRGRDIGVMTSQSEDGEYIARTIDKFGFLPVRGSSSRGGARALLEMRQLVEAGHTVAFTIDGPRGPKYLAKPGPVLLAKSTQKPMLAFHFAVDRAWVLNTWDEFIIPKPFARVLLRVSRYMWVPAGADDATMQRHHQDLQESLDRVRVFAEENLRTLTRP
ncbi:MAG: lysophospholipid acyltransferase family protein [Candidatus Koribacter versatilis]|uniref:Lysophospholipid acyltransferase family protein n=1 Tax=Candidatus Korobacter versatilis TaxID=658062 RepID=A0A932EQP8_9BACT|nr:lysophospholipid acyltransferase family protein [Candidatus Koribacter versatilis]